MTCAGGTPVGRIILGSGRSGTTWVLDCLAEANSLRPVFEPLHPDESPEGRRHAYSTLAAGDSNELLRDWFIALAGGRIHSKWIDYRAPRNVFRPDLARLLAPEYARRWTYRWRKYLRERTAFSRAAQRETTIIKCIRANLMAGWLSQTARFRVALIVRHPCAAVESQRRLRYDAIWDPAPVLARYRADARLHEVTNGRYLKLLSGRLSTLQSLALNWVIENQWPVERSETDGYAVVYYEDLATVPADAWPALCAALELESIPGPNLQQRPSQQATIDDRVEPKISTAETSWQRNLSRDDLDEIQDILDRTECRLYRVDDPRPLIGRAATGVTERGG
jgi:hypothetical protein